MSTLQGPFLAAEALAAQTLTFRELRFFHRAIHPGVWAPRGVALSLPQRACAAWLWSRRRAVVAGLPAAALLGDKWIDDDVRIELIHTNRRPPPQLTVHADALGGGETRLVCGLPVTTAARTAFDLGRRLPLHEGVQHIDALMNLTHLGVAEVEAVAAAHPGVRGLLQLSQTLQLVDAGADSPYESRTRLLLMQAGFPRPQTQIEICSDYGRVLARIDMGWPEWKVGVDFEGAHHWTDPRQRSWDIERYELIADRGWLDIRLTSGILHNRSAWFLRRVEAALLSRGCPKTW